MNRQRLVSAAQRLLASRADAEDAVQDTYLRALATSADPLGLQPAWLHTVLRNVAIDRLRRRRLESDYAERALPLEETTSGAADMQCDCEMALRQLLGRVGPADAAAILLYDVFGFDHAEIARIVGKGTVALRQMLHRARARARRVDHPVESEEGLVALYWGAVEARDPVPLMRLLRDLTASVRRGELCGGRPAAARSSSVLLQRGGRYAIALVLDGVVLCVVPIDAGTTPVGEPA
jgi:RNA polymerase sigma factor (sigma-70 family)